MAFYRAYYHLVWATKYRSVLLTPDVEDFAHNIMRAKAIQLGAIVWALNGTENHVHLVVTPPRELALPAFIAQVKGVTSYRLNRLPERSNAFKWQEEYGAFTFDAKRLPNYIHYVEHQKEHHAQEKLIPILERTDDKHDTIREAAQVYTGVDSEWWREMLALK